MKKTILLILIFFNLNLTFAQKVDENNKKVTEIFQQKYNSLNGQIKADYSPIKGEKIQNRK